MPGAGRHARSSAAGPSTRRSYANRVRQVMDTYRQDGAAKVYWLTVPTPRDPDAARGHQAGQRGDRGRRAAVARARSAWSTRSRSSPRATLPRLDRDRRRGDDRPRVRRHPPQRRGLGDRRRRWSSTASTRTSRAERLRLRSAPARVVRVFSPNVCLNFFEPFSHLAFACSSCRRGVELLLLQL